jgi:hypothetical protein
MAQLTVPPGQYLRQYDPVDAVGTWSFMLACADLDDALGRRLAMDLVKAERNGLLTKHLGQSTARNNLAAILSPDVLQPGIVKYYRELGLI